MSHEESIICEIKYLMAKKCVAEKEGHLNSEYISLLILLKDLYETLAYGSYDCPQVWTLRRFRDNILAKTWYGRAFIRTYYTVSPTLVKWFGKTEWFKNLWKPTLDRMIEKLNGTGVEDTPYDDRVW